MDQLEELHPVRYAQVPHAALDGLPDLNSIGMLSIMLRHKPNFPFTVERVIKQKKAIPGPKLGETVAYGAMTTLIQHRWAARVKFRCAGGHMHTSIFRTATQFTLDDYREICGRFGAGTEKILHCKGCSDDPKIPVRTTIRTGASLQWEKDTSKNGTPIADLFAPGGPLATATGPRIPGTGVTSGDAPVPSFPGTGAPGPGTPGTFKNTSGEQEGEEGDTRARATGESSDGDEPIIWGVAGGADFVAPKRVSADLIREIAGKALLPGEHLDVEDHQRLASLVEAVRPVVEAQKGLSWEEYVAWLKQGWVRPDGRRAFKTLSGALSWRLQPEQVEKQALGWACEQRGAQEASEAQGERDTPQPRGGARTGACGVHGVETFEGTCVVCDKETAEEARRYAAAQAASQEPPVPDDFADEGQEPEDLDPEVLRQMEADLEAKAAAARERRERELAATKALFSKVRSGAATEEAARR